MDIQDNVYLTPADYLVRRIVAVCEQIPPEFLLNAAMGVNFFIFYFNVCVFRR
jgi:hypothetical protein